MSSLTLEIVQELLLAASYLNNEVLTDACSAFIVYNLKKTSIEKFENTYGVSMHISREEEGELISKYKNLIMSDTSAYEQALQ